MKRLSLLAGVLSTAVGASDSRNIGLRNSKRHRIGNGPHTQACCGFLPRRNYFGCLPAGGIPYRPAGDAFAFQMSLASSQVPSCCRA